ncbi:MAG: hypothetical protein ACLGPL_08535 [Acidobacteriota bacterium]
MASRPRLSLLLFLAVTLLVAIPLITASAKTSQQNTRFSGFGKVVSVNETDKTISITVDRASRALKDQVGKEVTFQLADNVAVMNCPMVGNSTAGCGMADCPMSGATGGTTGKQGGMMGSGGMTGQHGSGGNMGSGGMSGQHGGMMGHNANSLAITDIQPDDDVHFMGSFTEDANGKQFVIYKLMAWVY